MAYLLHKETRTCSKVCTEIKYDVKYLNMYSFPPGFISLRGIGCAGLLDNFETYCLKKSKWSWSSTTKHPNDKGNKSTKHTMTSKKSYLLLGFFLVSFSFFFSPQVAVSSNLRAENSRAESTPRASDLMQATGGERSSATGCLVLGERYSSAPCWRQCNETTPKGITTWGSKTLRRGS